MNEKTKNLGQDLNQNRQDKKKKPPRLQKGETRPNKYQNKYKKNNKKRRGRYQKSQNKKTLTFEKIEKTSTNLLEKYLEIRKKLFTLYYRADPRQLEKLKKTAHNALQELRKHEENIPSQFREAFQRKSNTHRRDTTYSNLHNLQGQNEDKNLLSQSECQNEYQEDPHFLPQQEKSLFPQDFSQDTEESSGSMEDYQNYKNSI